MAECDPINNGSGGNVLLIEPNCVNINSDNVVNGISQYQDMYIFAELTAKSKGRTVITNGNVNTTTSKKINFIGNNQNEKQDDDGNYVDPNRLNFTTNYYDGSTGDDGIHYEGFGINNIKIKMNSSYVPQVNIQFVDIRGLAFFNQQDSPYRILFEFPPPIFNLTVKGYYGKPLTYQLHLVKYTSEFSTTNGNFIIDAQFIAMTFAPLTDVLFRYVVNTPLINSQDSMNPEAGEKPKNTFELILKLKNLYAAVSDKLKTDTENIEYQNIIDDISKIDTINAILGSYKDNETLATAGKKPRLIMKTPRVTETPYIYPKTNSITEDKLELISKLSDFDDIMKTDQTNGIQSEFVHQLFVGYVVGSNFQVQDNTQSPEDYSFNPQFFEYDTLNNSNFEKPLKAYKEQLLAVNVKKINFSSDDIIAPESFLNVYNIENGNNSNPYTKYYCIDISKYYYKIYKKKAELQLLKEELAVNIAKKINNMVAERLGMIPSIYNVFEIILNDVDKFFSALKSTSNRAYTSHNESTNKSLILNDPNYSEKKPNAEVYSFPLVINKSLKNREERVAPFELRRKVPFPELDFVEDFMDTFLLQNRYAKQLNTRNNQNDDGSYKWIPISPFDTTLGGAAPASPYLDINNDVRTETLRILLERFYILTQGTIPEAFYPQTTGEDNWFRRQDKENIIRSSAYNKLYATAEAINISSTIVNEKNAQTISIMAKSYVKSIDKFYEDIADITDTFNLGSDDEVIGNLYSFPTDEPKYFLVSPNDTSDGKIFTNKNNPDFKGVNLDVGNIIVQDLDEESTNPIDRFSSDVEMKSWFSSDVTEYFFDFTNENVIYLRDKTTKEDINTVGEIKTFTRYLTYLDYKYDLSGTFGGYATTETDDKFPGTNGQTDIVRQGIAYSEGNKSFTVNNQINDKNSLNTGRDIIDVWSTELGEHDTDVISAITGDVGLSSVIILSNFGYTVGPFNRYPTNLNLLVFDTPSAIEVPVYFAPYVGALLTAIEDGWDDDIVTFFETGGGSKLSNRGFYVLADLHDVVQYLSENDKTLFKQAYSSYLDLHENIVYNIKRAYDAVAENMSREDYSVSKTNTYKFFFNPRNGANSKINGDNGQFWDAIKPVITRTNLICNSQITFDMNNWVYPDGYTSLEVENSDSNTKIENDKYFTKLFMKLDSLLGDISKGLKEEEEELKKMKGDADIKNQLYYSFKNINDKWLSGTPKGDMKYPLLNGKQSLIDIFKFVDRGMNPIGETILNVEVLGDMLDNPNISLFSVLSQLLSLNGFEFFPLQNFLSFNDNEWAETFKINTGGYDNTQNTYFVCMYIGGASSYPSVSGNGFDNDGIIDITEPGVAGFSGDDSGSQYDENTTQEEDTEFPWRQVRAFRVRFGEQNQSMFTDIKIDSKEYPETNESIQILSRLAGDNNPDAPVPKGQSLYNLYENRSYKATVKGLGNAMIQPTQYFQIENIPMFNGAYIILDVEHDITANKMTTTFSGTKLLKYPMPRVLSAVALTNFDDMSGGDIVRNALESLKVNDKATTHYNSMYDNNVGDASDNNKGKTLKIG